MGLKNYGVPITVRIKSFLFHAIIALIVLIADVFVFLFLAQGATYACSELKRVYDSPHNEILFSGEPIGEDSFYYLRQQHVVGTKNENVNCDILMVMPGTACKNNDIYFSGTLESGTCVVSKNLAREYGLEVGDGARISGTDVTFKIVDTITAQSGLDKEYLHQGIVIIAYNKDMLNRQYSYISFTTDSDAYTSLISIVYIKNWAKENTNKLILYAAISVAALVITMLVCERFLFASRRRDYSIMVSMGITKRRLAACVLLENFIKYPLPSLLVAAIYSFKLYEFGAMYAMPALFLPVIGVLSITAYTFITVRRLFKCRTRTKR